MNPEFPQSPSWEDFHVPSEEVDNTSEVDSTPEEFENKPEEVDNTAEKQEITKNHQSWVKDRIDEYAGALAAVGLGTVAGGTLNILAIKRIFFSDDPDYILGALLALGGNVILRGAGKVAKDVVGWIKENKEGQEVHDLFNA